MEANSPESDNTFRSSDYVMGRSTPDIVHLAPEGMPTDNTGLALTRVMSPNNPSMMTSAMMIPSPNEALMLGLECQCQQCGQMTAEPVVCANCGKVGHSICLHAEMFMGYPFCGVCAHEASNQYAMLQDSHRRLQWQESIRNQLAGWKRQIREIAGVSATIGVALGGAAAASAQAMVSVVQGVAQGAK